MFKDRGVIMQSLLQTSQKSKKILKYKGLLKKFFYIINYPTMEESLCKMEIRLLFHKKIRKKYFFSYHYVNPSRSPFIQKCISILYTGSTIEDIIISIKKDNISCDNFKVRYITLGENDDAFSERRKIESNIGYYINGLPDVHKPASLYGIAKINNRWIFGLCEMNNHLCNVHNKKPYNYSNSLGTRVSRAVVNIAVANNIRSKVVDPCCGVGTVLIEALSMGIDIKGYELNPPIAVNANKNLKYFGFDPIVLNENMHSIKDKFDVSIIDIPYGLFSKTTLNEQKNIIHTARRISDKMVIITLEDMDQHIIDSGFKILDKCFVTKGKVKRFIILCK